MSPLCRAISFVFLAILVASGCSKTDQIDQKKFRKIYLTSKAIDASIKTKINFGRFGAKVRHLAKEISIANDLQLNKKEKELLKKYDDLYELYKDSAILWQMKMKQANGEYRGHINLDQNDSVRSILSPIIQKYPSLVEDKTSSKYGKPRRSIDADAAMREIWKMARNISEQTNNMYLGKDEI